MSLEEFYSELFGYATGWLGWSTGQALHTNVNLIMPALNARIDMVNSVLSAFSGKKPDNPRKKKSFAEKWRSYKSERR